MHMSSNYVPTMKGAARTRCGTVSGVSVLFAGVDGGQRTVDSAKMAFLFAPLWDERGLTQEALTGSRRDPANDKQSGPGGENSGRRRQDDGDD